MPDNIRILGAKGEMSGMRMKASNYTIELWDVHPLRNRRQKHIILNLGIHNQTNESLQWICAKSMIYSKTDTFTSQRYQDFYSSIYEAIKDTVSLAPGEFKEYDLLFVGKKKYSARLFRRSNRRDTLCFQLNVMDKDTLHIPMRNHHTGAIWNSY